MKKIIKTSTLKVASILSLSMVALHTGVSYADTTRAFYGDPTGQRVVAIDIPEMQIKATIPTAATPYPVDRAGNLDKVYAITRGASSVDVIDAKTLENEKKIKLDHFPRSGEAYNDHLGLVLIAGANKPLSSLVSPHLETVVATAGEDVVTTPNGDYGGSTASGHPYWLTKRKFVVIDRANRKISVYKVNPDYEVELLSTIDTPTTVHHIVKRDLSNASGADKRTYYAVAEGAPARNIPPQLLELYLKPNGKLIHTRSLPLRKRGVAISDMGSHHADMHPDGRHIYMGSNEGYMYVIDRLRMKIVKRIKTDAGTGHTRFVPSRNIGLITNHKGQTVTVVDTKKHKKIKSVPVSSKSFAGTITQSHTNYVDAQSRNYYAFATADGTFYKLNLDNLAVSQKLFTDGTPRQGVFLKLAD